MAPAEGRQELRHQPAGGGADDAEAGSPADLGAAGGDVGGDVVELELDPPGPGDDELTVRGQPAARGRPG